MISKQAIDREKRLNELHRASLKEVEVIPQRFTDKELIDAYLKSNKITVIEDRHQLIVDGVTGNKSSFVEGW